MMKANLAVQGINHGVLMKANLVDREFNNKSELESESIQLTCDYCGKDKRDWKDF